MTYFNFTKITPAAPNDPVVNEVTQINNNWDNIEAQLLAVSAGTGALTGAEQGQEWISPAGRFRTWDGAANKDPIDIDAQWSAWTALTLAATVAARPSFTPRWRNNSLLRRVELDGCILKDSIASAWPAPGVLVVVSATGAGQIPAALAPLSQPMITISAAALPTSPGQSAQGWHSIDTSGAFIRIMTTYMGGPGGGNFIALDGIEWWY